MSKPISQREARRLRKRVNELEKENSQLRYDRSTTVECHNLGYWDVGQEFFRAVKTAMSLDFIVEIKHWDAQVPRIWMQATRKKLR